MFITLRSSYLPIRSPAIWYTTGMTTDPHALILMCTWLLIWSHLYFGGPREQQVPPHQKIQYYSFIVGISLFSLYTFLYTGVGALPYALPGVLYYVGWVLLCIGSVLVILARQRLKHLSAIEVLQSLSPIHVPSVLDRYTAGHPMYLGILLITAASILWFPNYLALLCLIPLLTGMYGKWRTEETHHRRPNRTA